MSINYAKALSHYENKGKLGIPEKHDSDDILKSKCNLLVQMLRTSKFCVVLTGAGISTASGIPDFRGPKGVWTLERTNQEADSVPFELAQPTFTHFALNALERVGIVRFLISQNVDGLHAISGFPMNRLAELHGNVFIEKCERCTRKFFRSFPINSVGLKPTGRHCEGNKIKYNCRGKLRDTTLDWEDELPQPDYTMSQLYINNADLVLCLGTTLQINPVGNMPLRCKKNGGKLIIVNLQKTQHDRKADLVVNGRLDEVFRQVMSNLGIEVPSINVSASNCLQLVWQSEHPLDITLEEHKQRQKRKRINTINEGDGGGKRIAAEKIDLETNEQPETEETRDETKPHGNTSNELKEPHQPSNSLSTQYNHL